MKFILHGSDDGEIAYVERILDERKILYRTERKPKENYDCQIELIGPMGRLIGLREINAIFGKENSLETQTKTA